PRATAVKQTAPAPFGRAAPAPRPSPRHGRSAAGPAGSRSSSAPPPSPPRAPGARRPARALEHLFDDDRLVVEGIARSVDEGQGPAAGPRGELVEQRLLGGQFLDVPRAKFAPLRRIVGEPRAQGRARAEVAHPGVDLDLRFGEPSG